LSSQHGTAAPRAQVVCAVCGIEVAHAVGEMAVAGCRGHDMDEIISAEDYRAVVRALTVVRLHHWLLMREVAAGRLDEVTLIERLAAIDRQSHAIADILNANQIVTPRSGPARSGTE
jgi:hypothetical protein